MKCRKISQILCVILLVTQLGISSLAQLQLGPQRLVSMPAPPLRNTTRLSIGLPKGVGARPRISFVGRIGGVAFDSKAKPQNGTVVNSVSMNYSPTMPDGERLVLTIDGKPVSAPIYDWQLVPIAKFANSNSYSCFTLFGNLNNEEQQAEVIKNKGKILNYHQDFVNTLIGLRLFQLDNLIINNYAYELPEDNRGYVLGAGESPDIEKNLKGFVAYRNFEEENKDLFAEETSYVISDREEQVTFDLKNNKLNIYGDPSYYFWQTDEEALLGLFTGEAEKKVTEEILSQIQSLSRSKRPINPTTWLVNQVLSEIEKYDLLIGDYRLLVVLQETEIIPAITATQIIKSLNVKNATPQQTKMSRRSILNQQSENELIEQLITLKLLGNIQQAKHLSELSEKVSGEVKMIRQINPEVWDAGTVVMRYAAFFRYCKQKNPTQWNLFMRQIKRASALQPPVITPTVMYPEVSPNTSEKPKPDMSDQ